MGAPFSWASQELPSTDRAAEGLPTTRADAAEAIGGGERPGGGAGEAGLGCLPSEGAAALNSSTGLFY